MKRLTAILLFFALAAAAQAQTSAHFGAPKYVPENGKLLIIGQDLGAVGGLETHSSGYVDLNGQVPAGVTTYTDIPGLGGLRVQANWGAGDVNAQAYLDDDTFDNSVIAIGLYITGNTSGIIGGFRNSIIRQLADWIKQTDRPVFLRIGYEFDGPWNGFAPQDYIDAYQHIVHIFDEEDVRNVAYVWQSAGINTSNIGRWYPGDEYVNWVGYSHFDGPNPGQSIRAFAAEHNKPIMIAEATPRKDVKTENPDNLWRNWYLPMFNVIHQYDNIKALAYINANWEAQQMWQGQGWGDSRVEANETIQTFWLNETEQDVWLKASDSLMSMLQYQLWQDSVVEVTGLEPELPLWEQAQPYHLVYSGGTLHLHPVGGGEPAKATAIYDIYGKQLYSLPQGGTESIPHFTHTNQLFILETKRAGQRHVHRHLIRTNYE